MLRSGDDWPGLTGTRNSDPKRMQGSLWIAVVDADEHGFSGDFMIDCKGLSERVWLHPNGRKTVEPCDGVLH